MYTPVSKAFSAPPTKSGVPQLSQFGDRSSAYRNAYAGLTPDVGGLSPQEQQHLSESFSNLTYSAPAGGYLFNEDTNANSPFMKFGGSNPMANTAARQAFGALGSLPTTASNMPWLKFQSLNEGLGKPYEGPYGIR